MVKIPYRVLAPVKLPLFLPRLLLFVPLLLLLLLLLLVSSEVCNAANAQNYNAPSKAVSEQLVGAINDLAQTLGQQLGTSSSSRTEIFSPVSIGSMMFLLLRAANRETRNELLDILRLQHFRQPGTGNIPKNFARLLKEFTHDIAGKGILEELPGWQSSRSCYPTPDGADYEDDDDDRFLDEPIQANVIQLANAIFLQHGLINSTNFVKLARELYQAQIEQVDFREQPEAARTIINRWVNESTRGRIEQILSEELDTNTQMVAANALYFKATWETFFNEPQFTRPQPFFPDGEDQPSVMVPTMFSGGCYPYYSSPELDARIMAFPYRNRTTSMYVILPNVSDRTKLRQLQARLNSAGLDRLIGQMRLQKAIVQFPRMHVSNTYDLKQALQSLGLRSLFDRNKNNLKLAMPGRSKSRSTKLFISEMVHKIDLSINERGTEGGAVTITAMERSLPPVNFRVRGPFLLAIRHDPTKMLLFYGAVFDPS
ncbi:serine protease inhibitor 28Dc-like [Anopheles nili]|uniref:serine protease inhibitor 28Dc-like n=1 Tax=Anopheles nili TaxID=185578 RepID=UPI00237B03A1|nr:serine protease inhibitor 28Dc-like [Anopheles nili]